MNRRGELGDAHANMRNVHRNAAGPRYKQGGGKGDAPEILRNLSNWCELRRISVRGRDAGCPAPPAQIPACGTTAPGSCIGSDAEAFIRIWVHYSGCGDPSLHQCLQSCPG